jgi:hypothetical protein
VRIKALFSLAVLGYAGLALAQATPAQVTVVEEKKSETVTVVVKETPKPPAFVFELHGFVSTTMYFQDTNFALSAGQPALWIAGTYTADKPIVGADIRQTRLNFSVAGPKVMGDATPKAVVEVDFFGSSEFAPIGSYGDVSVVPRVRVAYVELNWDSGKHIIQIGQQNMLTIGTIPQSLSHIAFPATYAAGTVGWRQPGFWGWHTFGDDLKLELAWSIQKSGWSNAPAYLAGGQNAGITSGLPAFEARGKLMFGKTLNLWLSGHWQTVDRNGAGVIAVPGAFTDLQTVLGTVGISGSLGPLAYSGSAWYGKNAAPLLGNIVQFAPPAYNGDIFGWGAWGQVGMNVTKSLSGWFTYGVDNTNYPNVIDAYNAAAASAAGFAKAAATAQAAGNIGAYNTASANQALATGTLTPRLRNQNLVVMLRYQSGGFALGAEWLYSRTTDVRFVDTLTGNQISVTGNYYF